MNLTRSKILAVIFDVGRCFCCIYNNYFITSIQESKIKKTSLDHIRVWILSCKVNMVDLDFLMPETLELLLTHVSFAGLILFSAAVLQTERIWMNRRSTFNLDAKRIGYSNIKSY
jgi:hypothetical protein